MYGIRNAQGRMIHIFDSRAKAEGFMLIVRGDEIGFEIVPF